jgi:hypothetical protein
LGLGIIDPISTISAISFTSGTLLAVTASSNSSYEVQKCISPFAIKPTFIFSSEQVSLLGFDISIGFTKWMPISYRFNFGVNLMFKDYANKKMMMVHTIYVYDGTNDPDAYRSGVISVGIGGVRFGINSEKVRHVFQNQFAHTLIQSDPWYKVLAIPLSFFWYFGTGLGDTLW